MKRILRIIVAVFVLALFVSGFYKLHLQNVKPIPYPQEGRVETPALISPVLNIKPTSVIQGEPVLITLSGLKDSTTLFELRFSGSAVEFMMYNGQPSAFVPISLSKKPGDYSVQASFNDGSVIENVITVVARPKVEAPLGIPQKLGGNSTTSQKNLVSTLSKENAMIKELPTAKEALWNKDFVLPIKDPLVTDHFGYSRLTGQYTISHLGTDFRATEGVPVQAMNSGKVVMARNTVVYGNIVVIDHGLGLETLYAHLSKMNVNEGSYIERGQIIGQSGKTGYAEQPHLHVSVKINSISVDPIKFLELFEKR